MAAVHDGVTADEVHDARDGVQGDVLSQNLGGVLGANQTGFQHRETGGHPHNECAAHQEVEGVERIFQLGHIPGCSIKQFFH